MEKKGVSHFSVGNFLSHVAEEHLGRTLLCFKKFLVRKQIMDRKGVSRFSVGNCLSKIAGKHRGRTVLFFRNVLTSKFFWTIGVSQLCLIFCLISTKTIVGEPFCVSEIFWCQAILDKKGCHNFVGFFCLTSPKIIVGEPVCVSEIFWYRNVLIIGVSRFCWSSLSHSTEKFRRGILLFRKSSGIEKLLDNKVSRLCRKFSLTVPKNFVKERFCLSEKF